LPREALAREARGDVTASRKVLAEDGKEYFVLDSQAGVAGLVSGRPRFGPAPAEVKRLSWLRDGMQTIARTELLLGLASSPAPAAVRGADRLRVACRLSLAQDQKDEEVPLDLEKGKVTLHDQDIMIVEAANKSAKDQVSITLFLIDDRDGITQWWPEPGQSNVVTLAPGQGMKESLQIKARKPGQQHLVIVAVKVLNNKPVDFSWLAQAPFGEQEKVAQRTPPKPRSPLDQLLQDSLYGKPGTRQARDNEVNDYVLQVFTWNSAPRRPAQRNTGQPGRVSANGGD
jgi:hypothetical protein